MQKKMFWTGVAFMLPITVVLFAFLFLPVLQSFYYSLTDWKGIGAYHWIGFENYRNIFDDPSFVESVKRTLMIGISAAILTNLCGLAFAMLLDRQMKSKSLLRSLFYLPNIIPVVVAAFIWRYILDANSGMLNETLGQLTGGRVTIPWIDSPDHVVWSIIVISVWQMMGPVIIIYLAALQGVSPEMKEAAMIDGASKPSIFYHVTLPLITPGITVNVLIGLANGIRIFDLPFALTGGGPANASETLAIRIYRFAFQSSELSYGMAASFVLTLLALVITFFFVGVSRKIEKGAHGE
ncbi:carbohydrate ABC transporter permease [Cohnella herbarum]|uniref:Sugar ABC transporter permease n=1 Tax=Cohnella herbarum TaxID=2728023 RepID=A0A7Z2ZPP3_9BACL|nr:sugar ABC transporter permease [Cohnella herbarum]QJD87125.1 sugar ABC transporter permease [Cohnella herbarum]